MECKTKAYFFYKNVKCHYHHTLFQKPLEGHDQNFITIANIASLPRAVIHRSLNVTFNLLFYYKLMLLFPVPHVFLLLLCIIHLFP